MKKNPVIAIVGASGAVGQELIQLIQERDFPYASIRLFGSERSAGTKYTIKGQEVEVELLRKDQEELFEGVDLVFTSAGASTSVEHAELITKHGAIMIDNSSAFRMDPDVPLVVPEVNPSAAFKRPKRIIANPNCTTIQMVVALNALHAVNPVKRVHVATYQSASGAGASGMMELEKQVQQGGRGETPEVNAFAYQLLYNLIPQIDLFTDNDYTKEEMKMYHETRKIMDAEILVSATCVRVPVLRAHSESIWVEMERAMTPKEAREAFEKGSGVIVLDEPSKKEYPMPLELSGKDPVYVGRIRQDLTNPNGIAFWCVSDQIRKGAALNAIQIAELLLSREEI